MDTLVIILVIIVGIPLLLVGLAAIPQMFKYGLVGFFVGGIVGGLAEGLHLVKDASGFAGGAALVGAGLAYLFTLIELISELRDESRKSDARGSSSLSSEDYARFQRLSRAQEMRVSGQYSEQEVLDAYDAVDRK